MVSVGNEGFDNENKSIDISGEFIVFEDSKISSTYSLKEQRKKIREWAKANLSGKTVHLSKLKMTVTFAFSGIKEAINQPHKHIVQKNEFIKKIESELLDAEYIKSETDQTGDENFVFHYFRTIINSEDSYIVLKEIKKEGKIIFYSIVDKIKNNPGPR
jgi:hypothetical protein